MAMKPWHASLIGWILIIAIGISAAKYLTWAETEGWTMLSMALGLGLFYLALALTPWFIGWVFKRSRVLNRVRIE